MIALRLAMRCTPMASVIVSTTTSPSGIMATASATAARNMSTSGWPCTKPPTAKVMAASDRMAHISQWLKRAMRRVSGVASTSVWASSCEMRPISVARPVATTTPVAVP